MSSIKEIQKVLRAYDTFKAEGRPAALALVVGVAGSSYRRIGARLLVADDGRCVGGISGGCLEGDALRRARTAIFAGQPSVRVYDTLEGEDRVIGIGLGCNGRIEVLFQPLDYTKDNPLERLRRLDFTRDNLLLHPVTGGEPRPTDFAALEASGALAAVRERGRSAVHPVGDRQLLVEYITAPLHLYVAGHNYDLPPLLAQCRLLGWDVTLVGPLKRYQKDQIDQAKAVISDAALGEVAFTPRDAVVLMTHDYHRDLALLPALTTQPPDYLGILGPRKRFRQLLDDLEYPDLLTADYLHAPIGLDIGALDPYEITVSVVAEILARRRGRNGGGLRRRSGSIH